MSDADTPSAQVFDIVRAAVTLARNEHIRTVASLRVRLAALYPDAPEDIQAALLLWAGEARKTACEA